MPPASRLEFRDLSRRFGALRVLRQVDGAVDAGQSMLVTGANGSGKSTLLRCLAGLLAPQAGTITYRENGRDLDVIERRLRVGYVAPDLSFYEELTTLENLQFFARLRRAPAGRCRALLERVGLPEDRLAGALSSGMRQRLRWCWAKLHEPVLLLLDEPQQNLDRPGITLVGELIEEHLAAGGLAVVANPSELEIPRVTSHVELAG